MGPQGPVWTGAENLAPTGIQSPDRPARSESLYRLSYPDPIILYVECKKSYLYTLPLFVSINFLILPIF
jgi:hypothetical protein